MRKASQPHLDKCGLECWNALKGGGDSCWAARNRVEGQGGGAGKRVRNKVGVVGDVEMCVTPPACSPATRVYDHRTQISTGLSQPKRMKNLILLSPEKCFSSFPGSTRRSPVFGKESRTVLLTPFFHMSNLYADSNDCINFSQNILAVYMTPKNCFDRKPPNTAKGWVLVENKGVHAGFYRVCQNA